ncbi:ACP S-malonyltransferase [Spongisporangium articulatum]|uniref:Malonyl CoA-acyl carrier protein transacylase n=1 Tax=Spongisporangium articulatum TaxID=3362603 RepID=A0ABW8AI50_9ACTN
MTVLGVMFPGQGTQKVGMGRVLERGSKAASAVFDTADAVLERDVRGLCFRGPTPELTLTQNAQVAIFTSNAAALAALREEGHEPVLAMGHSVGELNALVAAGVLSLEDGLRLVAARGRLMGLIETPGTMASILGLAPDDVRALCERSGHVVVPALVNGPENIVVSGEVAGVEAVEKLALEAGARKATRLTVSSAFHSPLMAEAVPEWEQVVAAATMNEPRFPVVLNTTGAVATGADDARQALVDQLTGPVRWVEDVRAAVAQGVDLMVEAGDSKVLTALVRAIEPDLSCVAMHDPRALRRLRTERAG